MEDFDILKSGFIPIWNKAPKIQNSLWKGMDPQLWGSLPGLAALEQHTLEALESSSLRQFTWWAAPKQRTLEALGVWTAKEPKVGIQDSQDFQAPVFPSAGFLKRRTGRKPGRFLLETCLGSVRTLWKLNLLHKTFDKSAKRLIRIFPTRCSWDLEPYRYYCMVPSTQKLYFIRFFGPF